MTRFTPARKLRLYAVLLSQEKTYRKLFPQRLWRPAAPLSRRRPCQAATVVARQNMPTRAVYLYVSAAVGNLIKRVLYILQDVLRSARQNSVLGPRAPRLRRNRTFRMQSKAAVLPLPGQRPCPCGVWLGVRHKARVEPSSFPSCGGETGSAR